LDILSLFITKCLIGIVVGSINDTLEIKIRTNGKPLYRIHWLPNPRVALVAEARLAIHFPRANPKGVKRQIGRV